MEHKLPVAMINSGRIQIQCIMGDHRISSGTTIKPFSSHNLKGSSVSHCLHLHPGFKPPSFTPIKRGPLWVHLVKAARCSDRGGGGGGGGDRPDQTKNSTIFGVFAAAIGYLMRLSKGIFDFLSKEKKAFEKLEDKIEKAAEAVEEVAKFTEEIAEKVEGISRQDGIVHKTAQIVDNISETVGEDAEIVENQVERIKKAIKAIDEKVDNFRSQVKEETD